MLKKGEKVKQRNAELNMKNTSDEMSDTAKKVVDGEGKN